MQSSKFRGEKMNQTRRLFSFLIVFTILLGGFIVQPAPAKAIKNFTVEVMPKLAGAVAEYKFQFVLEKKIEVHQWFHLRFPKGTILTPPIPDENTKKEQYRQRLKDIIDSISFNNDPCTACLGMPIITFESDGTMTLKFSTPMDLDPAITLYQATTITILAKAGITNPDLPGKCSFQIRNQQELEYAESQPVTILSQDVIIIQLTIGSMKATVNGEEKTLPLAPFVQKGYTLVPFRFIGEALQATINYTTNPLTKQVKAVTYELDGTFIELTIGSLRAMVNGNPILLDVPPQIKNGTTVVPLRFVTTTLIPGCIIDWNSDLQRITITYSKKPNNGDTLAVVETFDAIWLNRAFWNGPRVELNQELGASKVAFITYYVDSTDDHPFPRLSCPDSEARMKWYMQDKGLPTVFFNGILGFKGTPNSNGPEEAIKAVKNEYKKRINAENRKESPLKITGTYTKLAENSYKIKIDVEVIKYFIGSNLQLVSVLTESNIPYQAISGQKIHYFVFREYLKPKEIKESIGIPIQLTKPGDTYSTEFTVELDSNLYKNNLNVIFFVQDMTNKNILQGQIIPLTK
jgi:hypothetical protein